VKAGLRFLLVGAAGIAALVSSGVSASAANGPYTGTGYDISYPQCNGNSLQSPLPTGNFGIVGVNHGRPFTTNPCFGPAYMYATAPGAPAPSLYINLAYSGAYRRDITPGCNGQTQSQAWKIGCSEADTSFKSIGQRTVFVWWLDVETANSWSTNNASLNQDTIQGAVDRLHQLSAGVPVGVYSTASSWKTITGANAVYTPVNTAAEWVAGVRGSCATSNQFDANPIWLSQLNNGFDYDNAC